MKVISRNKRAKRDYEILDTFQAGISLLGSEIKSIRTGDVSMSSSFVNIVEKQALLKNVNIKEYDFSRDNHDPLRDRPLLLNKSELRKIRRAKEEKGNSIIALAIGINKRGFAKVDIAIARGRNKVDKREYEKQKDFKKLKKQYL